MSTKNNNKKSPKMIKRSGGPSKNTIALIILSVALVAVVTALIILLNIWHSKPENQPQTSEPSSTASTTESVDEPEEEPEPEITDVEFGSSDYSREFFSTDLFIGDSIATGFTDYSKLDDKNVAANVNLTPYKAHAEPITLSDGTSGTALSYAEAMQPKRIFMMLGFNGLNSPIAMEGSFRTLTEKLEAACPNAVIYCYSITPLTADSSAAANAGFTNKNVLSFNEYLKTMCSELGVIYLDINSKMSDENGCLKEEYNEYDGMHISAPTYDLILAYTQKYITEMPEPEASSKHKPAETTAPEDTTTSMPENTSEPPETSSAPLASEPGQTSSELSSDYNKEFFADDLFIGDSITTGLSGYGILSPKNVAAAVGYTPYKAYSTEIELGDGTTGTAVDYAASMQPKRIFVMLGSNGITSAAAMEDSYRTLLDKLADKCPDSTIYCLSVTPVTNDSSSAANAGIDNSMITGFNKFIKALAKEKGLTYIDLYTLFSDDNGYFLHEYAENDGLHFKGNTYKVMLSYIESLI
ncbi:MAG: hypothetical protein J6A19_00740 [Oscillospiraceae bacterium]|nr:hypothetical protein [Oscillospiraceae bacterium]